jgi:hypothetical protein
VSTLAFGDAIIVAVSGGVGTLVGGTITAVVTFRIKLMESRASINLEQVAARRRQGERQAEVSQQLLAALTDLQATVWQTHLARLEGSRIDFPATIALLGFRAQADHCLLLASRLIASDIREHVRETVHECENLIAERSLQDVANRQDQVEKSFDRLGSEIAAALSRFEELAVQT